MATKTKNTLHTRDDLRKALDEALNVIGKQREEIQDLRYPKDTSAIEPKRPHATPSGPNPSNAIYPPGCGPMQLVWASGSYGSCVLGWQCDSFRVFESRQQAADWLREHARRIETWDKEIGT